MGDFYTTAFLSQAQGGRTGIISRNKPALIFTREQECQKGEGVKTQENLLPELIWQSMDY